MKMTLDQLIAALQEMRKKVGGGKSVVIKYPDGECKGGDCYDFDIAVEYDDYRGMVQVVANPEYYSLSTY